MAIGAVKTVEMLVNTLNALNLRKSRVDLVSISQVTRSISVVLSFTLIYWLSENLAASLFGMAIFSLLVLWIIDFKNSQFQLNFSLARALLSNHNTINIINFKKLSLLALIPPIDSVVQNLPRYIANRYGGLEDVGLLTIVLYIISPPMMVLVALASVVTPRLRDSWITGNTKYFVKLSSGSIVFSLLLCLFLYLLFTLFGDVIMAVLFSRTQTEIQSLYGLIFAGALFWYLSAMLTTALNATNFFLSSFVASVVGLFAALVTVFVVDVHNVVTYCLYVFLFAMLCRFFVATGFYIHYVRMALFCP
jgi:O-antigen/teichoic acid export membrane protein